jgi:hypothetical protein
MPEQDPIKHLTEIVELRFDDLTRRIEEQSVRQREYAENSDRRIGKIEDKFDILNDKFNSKSIDLAVLKDASNKEINKSDSKTSTIYSAIIGSVASIIVTVLTKMVGF